jgi:hypothetical protein
MTLIEIEQRRSRRAQRKLRKEQSRKRKRLSTLAAPLDLSNDRQILTFAEWCRLNRISGRTGRRILAGPDGPTVTQISANRIGISVGANCAWQQARART